jgi:hypothetical protein
MTDDTAFFDLMRKNRLCCTSDIRMWFKFKARITLVKFESVTTTHTHGHTHLEQDKQKTSPDHELKKSEYNLKYAYFFLYKRCAIEV